MTGGNTKKSLKTVKGFTSDVLLYVFGYLTFVWLPFPVQLGSQT